MARYGRVNVFPRILLLLLLVVILLLGGLIWFDVLGLVDARPILGPFMNLVGLTPKESTTPDFSDLELLDSMGVQKRELAISLHLQELEHNRELLQQDQQKYDEKLAQLQEQEKIQADRENSFNERVNRYDIRYAGLVQNAKDLTSMRPQDAVAILVEYDDQQLIDTLRVVQELADQEGTFSLVSTYLSMLPADRAATIQRLMTRKPTVDNGSGS